MTRHPNPNDRQSPPDEPDEPVLTAEEWSSEDFPELRALLASAALIP